MSLITGKWELISSEKYDEFLKAAGVGMIQRNIASKVKPTLQYLQRDGKWVQITTTPLKSFEVVFTPGEEFEEALPDGRKSTSLITIEGDTIIHKQNVSGTTLASETTRVFGKNEMVAKFKAGSVVSTRVFQRI